MLRAVTMLVLLEGQAERTIELRGTLHVCEANDDEIESDIRHTRVSQGCWKV